MAKEKELHSLLTAAEVQLALFRKTASAKRNGQFIDHIRGIIIEALKIIDQNYVDTIVRQHQDADLDMGSSLLDDRNYACERKLGNLKGLEKRKNKNTREYKKKSRLKRFLKSALHPLDGVKSE